MIERIPPDLVPVIVFVTAYDRYALDAFRVHALDYLLKPFSDRRFFDAATGSFVCRIAVKQEGRVVLVILNDGTRVTLSRARREALADLLGQSL